MLHLGGTAALFLLQMPRQSLALGQAASSMGVSRSPALQEPLGALLDITPCPDCGMTP